MKKSNNPNYRQQSQKTATISDDAFYLIALISLLKKMKINEPSKKLAAN